VPAYFWLKLLSKSFHTSRRNCHEQLMSRFMI